MFILSLPFPVLFAIATWIFSDWQGAVTVCAVLMVGVTLLGQIFLCSGHIKYVRRDGLGVSDDEGYSVGYFTWAKMSFRDLGFWIITNRNGFVRDDDGNRYLFAVFPPRFLIRDIAGLEARLREEGLWDIEQVRLLFSKRSERKRPR